MMTKAWVLALAGAAVGGALVMALHEAPVDAQPAPVRPVVPAAAPAPQVVRQAPVARVAPPSGTIISYAPIVERAAPAVVTIYSTKVVRQRNALAEDPFFGRFFGDGGGGESGVQNSVGSGVVVRANGIIVTNNHVIDGMDEIRVALADKRQFPAQIVLADPRTDLAVLKINPGPRALPVVKIGDSDGLKVGDIVFAIGNPFNVGQTVTHGIVSALSRGSVGVGDYQFFIQTDAAVNPGNSGGALINMNGELIGINTAIYSRSGGSNGIGFAIPVTMVKSILNGANSGKIVRPWLGVGGTAVTSENARTLRLDRPVGVLLSRVAANSPAARAGLRAGDVIYAVDGKEVGDEDALRFRIATKQAGQNAIITLIRNGAALNVTANLIAPPENPPRSAMVMRGNHLFNGVQVANLSPAFAQELGGQVPERGVIALDFVPGAPAARFGLLQQGDIFEQINGADIESVAQLQATMTRTPGGLTYRINRGGKSIDCGYRPPSQFYCRN
jgi:Do/DeqQ family serine protease